MKENKVKRVAQIVARHGIRPEVWLRKSEHAFHGIDFHNKSVVDIGSGVGWASYYAAARGARRVVSIEPEADGSRNYMLETAAAIRAELGLDDIVEIIPKTFEESGIDEQFDIIIINNAINHFNEAACSILHKDEGAREAYRPLFRQLAKACKPGGTLLITDCTNRNFFGDLGMKSPLMRTIEWEKHQPPEMWAELIAPFGFEVDNIAWTPHARLGLIGRIIGSNRLGSYFINSHFRLRMCRARA